MKHQIIIVGGGPAGIAAGIAAARNGCKTLIVEEDFVLGGCITDYYVAMLCGGPVTGIVKELEDICIADYKFPNGVKWFAPSAWIRAIDDLTGREPNLSVMRGARVCGVKEQDGVISAVEIDHAGFSSAIEGEIFIDATGSGIFSELAGAEVMYGREAKDTFNEPHAQDVADDRVQQVTWMYISQKLPGYPPFDMSKLEYAARGVLPQGMTWFHLVPEKALAANDGIYLHWGCATGCKDTRDPVELAKSQQIALDLMKKDHETLHRNGYVVHLASRIGVRECRRIKGQYVITENDIFANHYPEDTVACGNYSLDVWGESIEHRPVKGYGIPYRALLPLRLKNLLLAGKLISGSHLAMSAYRVIPIAGSIGQAAGTAAALAIKSGIMPEAVNVARLRQNLENQQLLLAVPQENQGH